ncbi:MAG TPA: hypothetical protein PKC43_02775 [Phycisphaerales bacterium]|nr:hypothetical protein [Phycisphaerales bacterium]HMP36350.1 hypothetical protein [Phycisphaerales bacterium]
MNASRIGWALWALIPVAAISFHYGPGQASVVVDRAARLQDDAVAAEREAMALQESAYEAHLAGIEARRRALRSSDPDDAEAATRATERELAAYDRAAEAWGRAADAHERVLTALGDAVPEKAREIQLARARAMVRSGDVWTGIGELESSLEALESAGEGDSPLGRQVREELATACYYGARLLRLSGMPAQEWMVESGIARQQFRYLAERERAEGGAAATNHQRNLELVLNLEQAALVELQARPLPKDSPCQGKMECRDGTCKNRGKRPGPRGNRDARGAGGPEEIRGGW